MKLFTIPIFAYIASVVILNIGFAYVPMIETPIGMLSPMAVLAGLVFVLRDFAQRAAGHGVLFAMVIATVLSFFLADPYVALASAAAFAVAELVDYIVYTVWDRPFHKRILWSSIISTPIDTLVFLLGISAFTVGTFALMVAAKLVAAFGIYIYYLGLEYPDEDDEYERDLSADFNYPGDLFPIPTVPVDGARKVPSSF